jgi:hypothetical protein
MPAGYREDVVFGPEHPLGGNGVNRIVGIALLSCWFGLAAAPSPSVPSATSHQAAAVAEPTIVGVIHHGPSDPKKVCAVFEAGMPCREISHWIISVNSKEYALDAYAAALKEALAKWPKPGADPTPINDLQAGIVLLSRGPTSPWAFVARVEAVAHDAGIHRICACESATPPSKVDQILIDVSSDSNAEDRRKYGDKDVTPREALVPVIRNACTVARARGAEPLVRIRVYGACSWSTVARSVAECREAGATAIDVATKTTD